MNNEAQSSSTQRQAAAEVLKIIHSQNSELKETQAIISAIAKDYDDLTEFQKDFLDMQIQNLKYTKDMDAKYEDIGKRLETMTKNLMKFGTEKQKQALREQQNEEKLKKILEDQKRIEKELNDLQQSGASKREIRQKEKELQNTSRQAETQQWASQYEHSAVSKNGNFGIGTNYDLKKELGNSITAAIGAASKALDDMVDKAVGLVTEFKAKMNYRLSAAGSGWENIYGNVKSTIGNSGVVEQEKVIRKIGEAVDAGIAYNVEQRSFLATLSENIQSTFDAFNSNLTRIIRIQQSDSTVARLGMEKALNDLLTNMYKDSSYLNDMYDSVSASVFELSALATREGGAETEFIIQKWLGSLYSLGASSNAINAIAQGLGYLGSGNVSALAGNTQLQTLLAMSSSRAGLDYANLLTGGLNATDTNKLLLAMVEYLAEIADSTSENKVVTSAYGNVFGLSPSDIKSFKNLAQSAQDIFGQTLGYGDMAGNTQTALNQYVSNMGNAAYFENMLKNIKLSTGMTYGDGAGYMIYKVVDLLDKLTNGGPEINLQYWGLGSSFKIPEIIKSGMFGFGLIGSLISGGLFNNKSLDLKNWGYEDAITRGTGLNLRNTSGTSASQTVGSASSSDVEQQSLKEGSEKSESVENASGKKEKKDVDDLYLAMVNEGEKHQLSDVRLNTEAMNENLKKALTIQQLLMDINSRNSINVNLSRISGKDISEQNGLVVQPNPAWRDLLTAIAVLIKYGQVTPGTLGTAVQVKQEEKPEYTTQDLVDTLMSILEGKSEVPVRVESMDNINNLMRDLSR